MNRYPAWKYTLIAIALAVGLLYTIPNFFGEVPAVQVSPVRSTEKPDEALRAKVEDILKGSNIPAHGVTFDATGVKERFEDTETQYRARQPEGTVLYVDTKEDA